MNSIIRRIDAVAEKLVALKTAEFFEERKKRAHPGDMLAILEMAGTDEKEADCFDIIEP